MSRPTPGTTYTVRPGDTLRGISRRAYGNDQSGLLVRENSRILSGRPASLEGLPTIYAGDVLEIPATTSRYDGRTVTADFDTALMVRINGRGYRGVTAGRIERGLNSIADGFTFTIPYDPNDRDLVDALRPYQYQNATLHIGGEPYITAQIVKPRLQFGNGETVATIECRTVPGDMIECMSSRESLEYNDQTLLEIGNDIARRYNLKAFSAEGDSGKILAAVKEVTETDFAFLSRLAAQKGFLVTSARDGNLMFTRAAVDARPVATLRAGQFPFEGGSVVYDGSKRFSTWFGYAEVADQQPATAYLRDSSIPARRPFAFTADESEADNIEAAVRWRMAKSTADATSVTLTLAGWRNPDGQLWEENMKVLVYAPQLMLFQETEMITQVVNLSKAEAGGDITSMTLVLPGAYNLTMPDSFPWDGYAEAGGGA